MLEEHNNLAKHADEHKSLAEALSKPLRLILRVYFKPANGIVKARGFNVLSTYSNMHKYGSYKDYFQRPRHLKRLRSF